MRSLVRWFAFFMVLVRSNAKKPPNLKDGSFILHS
ncbi:hypothetical protein PSE_1743 [Pseudovibrio sp. FO-BEG1]|nr:hypothetical protein PSE_1743 [Pseudovibrio sp. FO-BEG1]